MNPPVALAKHLSRAGIAVLLSMLLAGCVYSTRQPGPDTAGLKDFQLVYFQPEPHRRLHVEVDAVEGTEFSDAELGRLETALREWTQKPHGVSVVKSSVIPRSVARGHSADSLARLYLDGPPAVTNESPPAYAYVLVYDSRVNRNPAQSPRAESFCPMGDKVPAELAAPAAPQVLWFPYPAMIYVDRSWLGGLLHGKDWDLLLLHEAGHVLGLVSRETQVENHHCATKWCLMNAHVSESVKSHVANWFERGDPKPLLCEACASELRQYQTSTNAAPTHFAGPVLVRIMEKYHVLALPGFAGLCIGDSVDEEADRFIGLFRKLKGQRGTRYAWYVKKDLDRESLLQAVEAAKLDFDPTIRHAAGELERELRNSTSD